LALAVPIVHVVAAGRLFEHGMMMRDGSALERLAEIDNVDFDKTGTLTIGIPQFAGLGIKMLSGDRNAAVKRLAESLGVADYRAGLTPEEKLEALNQAQAQNQKTLMVGDGINDAPALRAAHVSMAPSSAADVGRNAADFVLTRDRLDDIPFALNLAKRAALAVKQNFGLALSYNAVAIPLAVMGFATPLVASIAMSSSSVLVTLNALRLRLDKGPEVKVILHPQPSKVVAAE
jgi:cation transport ATPase